MGKKQSRFTVPDSRNQGTKQLHPLYTCGISIVVAFRSFDRTLQIVLFKQALSGKLNTKLIYSEGLLEGPLGDKGSWYLGGRRSYVDLLPIEVDQITAFPRFWDYQFKATYDLNAKHEVTANAFAADDFMELKFGLDDVVLLSHHNSRKSALRWHLFPRYRFNGQKRRAASGDSKRAMNYATTAPRFL